MVMDPHNRFRTETPRTYWVRMSFYDWSCLEIEVHGQTAPTTGPEGTDGFLAVYPTREAAEGGGKFRAVAMSYTPQEE